MSIGTFSLSVRLSDGLKEIKEKKFQGFFEWQCPVINVKNIQETFKRIIKN